MESPKGTPGLSSQHIFIYVFSGWNCFFHHFSPSSLSFSSQLRHHLLHETLSEPGFSLLLPLYMVPLLKHPTFYCNSSMYTPVLLVDFCFLLCVLTQTNVGITWEHFRNANSQVLPQMYWIRHSGVGPGDIYFNKSSRESVCCTLGFQNHCPGPVGQTLESPDNFFFWPHWVFAVTLAFSGCHTG